MDPLGPIGWNLVLYELALQGHGPVVHVLYEECYS
jgi:hypothetical protein